MATGQTRADENEGRGAQLLVIGRSSVLGDLRPVARALVTGIALGLGAMMILRALVQ